MSVIRNKFKNARCSACGKKIGLGDRMYYRKSAGPGRTARCMDCGPHGYTPKREAPEPKRPSDERPSDERPELIARTIVQREAEALADPIEDGRAERIEDSAGRLLRYRSAFPSAGAFADFAARYAKSESAPIEANRKHARESCESPRAWNGYTDLARLSRLAYSPEPKEVARVAELRDVLSGSFDAPTGRKRKRRSRLDSGAEVDAERALRGEFDCYSDLVRTSKPREVIRLAVNCAISCGTDQSVLFYRGAAIAALADALNQAGYGVEVFATMYTRDTLERGSGGVLVECALQRSDKPQDLSALACGLADVGFLRVGFFAAMLGTAPAQLNTGLGYPQTMPSEERARFDVLADQEVCDERSAIEFLKTEALAILSRSK